MRYRFRTGHQYWVLRGRKGAFAVRIAMQANMYYLCSFDDKDGFWNGIPDRGVPKSRRGVGMARPSLRGETQGPVIPAEVETILKWGQKENKELSPLRNALSRLRKIGTPCRRDWDGSSSVPSGIGTVGRGRITREVPPNLQIAVV